MMPIPIITVEKGGAMRSCKHWFYVFIFLSCGILSAQTFTISIVQNENAPAIAIEMSRTIEDELLDFFFNSGFIVSNTDISFDGKSFSKKNFGIKEAAFGMSDFLLVVQLTYASSEKSNPENKKSYAQLDSLVWRLARVKDSHIISEVAFDISSVPVKDFDPYKQSRMLTKKVAEQAIKTLRDEVKKEK